MNNDDKLRSHLHEVDIPQPDEAMKTKALGLAMESFEKNKNNIQGSENPTRLTSNKTTIGRSMMKKSYVIGGTVAACTLAVLVTTSTLYKNPFEGADKNATEGGTPSIVRQNPNEAERIQEEKNRLAALDETITIKKTVERQNNTPFDAIQSAEQGKKDQQLGGRRDVRTSEIAEAEMDASTVMSDDESRSNVSGGAVGQGSSARAKQEVAVAKEKTRTLVPPPPPAPPPPPSSSNVAPQAKNNQLSQLSRITSSLMYERKAGKVSNYGATPAPSVNDQGLEEEMVASPAKRNLVPQQHAIGKLSADKDLVKSMPESIMCCPQPEPVIIAPREENRDKFKKVKINPFKSVTAEPVSTFSADVDTASYAFTRKQLNNGRLPVPDAVRVEEFVNYFDYNYATPSNEAEPFKPTVSLMPTPWNANSQIMHIGIKGYDVDKSERPPANIVFLLDVSGSMSSPDKLPLLKSSLEMMVNHLNPDDTISIAVYAGAAGTVLEPTKVRDKHRIIEAFSRLNAGGSTAGGAGINLAYALAQRSFNAEGVNRVILATDGDFNVGIRSQDELKRLIEQKRKSGIFLSVLGFGKGNYNDALMQTLAQNGNGNAAYIDNLNEARKVLIDEAGATLFTIAKDVKLQVEFNPNVVSEYRLLGYETRALKREDFNNDKIDAGEIGAGHEVTALYEVVTVDAKSKMVDPLRYGNKDAEASIAPPKASDELAFVKLRYKLPSEDVSKLITHPVMVGEKVADIKQTSDDARFGLAVASFAEKLRGGDYLQDYSYGDIINLALTARGDDRFGYRNEFIRLVRLAESLSTTSSNTGYVPPVDGLRYR